MRTTDVYLICVYGVKRPFATILKERVNDRQLFRCALRVAADVRECVHIRETIEQCHVYFEVCR